MTYVITEACSGAKGQGRRRRMPGRLHCEGEPMPCIRPGECADRGACEPACPAEAIFSKDDVPAQRAQFSTENAKFLRPARPPGGTAKTGPLPHDTGHVASYITSQ